MTAALAPAPTAADLLAVMIRVRDAANFDLNPHEGWCHGDACGCERGVRIAAAWHAFHEAIRAAHASAV
jgi:hypothetical protein